MRRMTDAHPELEPFTVDAIVAEATLRADGLDDFGEGPFLEPLARFLESLEREARLNDLGRLIARERALLPYSSIASGVRCAETTWSS